MRPRGAGRIRAPRRGLTKDEVDTDESWSLLDRAFREIHSRNAGSLSFEQLFRSAYRLVLKKKGEFLFDKVRTFETEILDTQIRPPILDCVSPILLLPISPTISVLERNNAGERYLTVLKNSYLEYTMAMSMITATLMYMDRVNSSDAKKFAVYPAAMNLFRERILASKAHDQVETTILDVLIQVILDMVAFERQGDLIDRNLIKGCCSMLESLYETSVEDESTKLYITQFEPKFLEASQSYFAERGRLLVEAKNAATFCAEARASLHKESTLCQQALSSTTSSKIQQVVETEMISKNIKEVINFEGTGVRNMLENDKIEDLQNIYDLVARIDPKLASLKLAIHEIIQSIGEQINNAAVSLSTEKKASATEKTDGEKPAADKQISQQTYAAITWVENVLELKSKYDKLLERAFRSDSVMARALEIAFQEFINKNTRSPEFLSLFLDEHLKKGNKNKTEAEIDAILDNGVTLLQYLSDRDLLDTYYHKHMAKRLINKKSISRDMERQMLSKMKIKLGNQFTTKMEALLKDTEVSETLNNQYKDHVNKLGERDPDRIDIEASILTTTMWPIGTRETSNSCVYPAQVDKVRSAFEQFYLGKHTGRKLTWLPHMGDATIRATYKNPGGKARRYELIAPTYCMVVLDLYNENDSLTYKEIQEATNIPEVKLKQVLQSMSVAPKTRLLKKEPKGREVNDTDVFSYNDSFSSQYVRIKVVLISESANRLENTEQQRETQKKADSQRGLEIDAAIVRIMKSRKTLGHQALMTETIQILSQRFQPDVTMIKKKIENLIEREYLERGEDPANPSYKYLA